MNKLLSWLLVFLISVSGVGQSTGDPTLLAEINRIKAIDNRGSRHERLGRG